MASETADIRKLLSSTGSDLYKQIGLYLEELEFTCDILDDDESEFCDLFAEDTDCERIGLPVESDGQEALKEFVISRCEVMITSYKSGTRSNCNLLVSRAIHLRNELLSQNSDVYKKIGALLFKYQVHCDDINHVDDLKLFLNKSDLAQMGLKNAAKQKLAFRKVLRIINDLRPTQPQAQDTIEDAPNAEDATDAKEQDALSNLLASGTVSADAFWSHSFAKQQSVSHSALGEAIRLVVKRTSSAYIECIILSIACVDRESSANSNDISLDAFKQYTEAFNASDIVETFEHTQNEFETLYEADQKKDFDAIQMSNFEETLFKIDIYGALLSDGFESEIWKHIICDKFISYLAMIMKLAFKFYNKHKKECGVEVLQKEIFCNYNRMSSISANHKSSFYSLSQSQLLYIVKLDSLAMNEEKLYSAVYTWCHKRIKKNKESIWDKLSIFVPFIRFPLMSMGFLCSEILPKKDQIFANAHDLLYVLIYKINVTQPLDNKKHKFVFDMEKLCCAYKPRSYAQNETENMSLDARLMKVSDDNQVLRQQNVILNQKNHKLKAKIAKLRDKKSGDMDDDVFAARAKKGRQRSVTNSFAPSHLAAVHAKQASIVAGNRKHSRADDDLEDRQKHIKQISKSVVAQVQDLEVGSSAVKFMVPFTPEQTVESQDLFAQMRKKMTDRSKGKSAHQRKLEKQQKEEAIREEQKREMEETKRRLREEAKKMNKRGKKTKKKPRKRASNHPDNTTMVIREDVVQNCEDEILETMHRDDEEEDEYASDIEPIPEYTDEMDEDDHDEDVIQVAQANDDDAKTDAIHKENDAINAIEDSLTVKPKAQAQPQIQSKEVDTDDQRYDVIGNNYGYPQIHNAMKLYYNARDTECTNPTHLILFAKKQAIPGVTFASANKYFKARRNDANVMPIHVEIAAEQHQQEHGANESDASGHSAEEIVESPPITITQSATDRRKAQTPPHVVDDVKQQRDQNTLPAPVMTKAQSAGTRRKSNPKLDGKKKKKKKLLVAAEMMGKLKKNTNYTRFETPMYILPLNVAERKKVKDELRTLLRMGLQTGYKVQLHRGNMKGTVKFIGPVHFTFGVVIGLELAGNGNGKHGGDIDKIKYFDSKRNSGLFVRVETIDKILDKKKLKSNKKYKEMDEITAERYRNIMRQQREREENDEEDDEIDLSGVKSRKEKQRLERFHLEIGDVVEVDKGRKGILHFCGNVHWTDKLMFGVEYVDKAVGKYNGTYGEIAYFKCPDKRGMFFTSDKIRKKVVLSVLTEW
eukprot:18752_1